MTRYTGQHRAIDIAADRATRADFVLPAGRLAVSPAAISASARMGTTATATFRVTNTGTAPATAQFAEEPGSFSLQNRSVAPRRLVAGHFSLASHVRAAARAGVAAATPYDPPWTPIADYPTPIMDEATVTDPNSGKVYSFGGFDGTGDIARAYVYDPDAHVWNPIAAMRYARERAAAAWINGKIYVVGGWDGTGATVAHLEVYDPASDTWSLGADAPTALAASGVAVHDARLYLIGGCDPVNCGHTEVQVYDPAANSWTAAAPYAEPTSWLACGTLYGHIDCAGGQTATGESTDAFGYDPNTDRWTRIASLPIDLAAMGYAVADNRLLVTGGVTQDETHLTNQGFGYDPDNDTWDALPNANQAVYRGSSTCGLYRVGGSTDGSAPIAGGEQLPGYGDCTGNFDVGWLSESTGSTTLAPGASATVTLTFDAGDASISQPGTYDAELAISTDTPYAQPPVDVSLAASPPTTWGKIAGTVRGRACDGTTAPLPGATVEIDGWAADYVLTTDAVGRYGLWLDKRNNPLTLIVAASGWQPWTTTARISAGQVKTDDFTLEPLRSCG